jgi:hypothetical protein
MLSSNAVDGCVAQTGNQGETHRRWTPGVRPPPNCRLRYSTAAITAATPGATSETSAISATTMRAFRPRRSRRGGREPVSALGVSRRGSSEASLELAEIVIVGVSGPNRRERGLVASGAAALDVALETLAGLGLDPALPVLCTRFGNSKVALRPRAGCWADAWSRSCLGRPTTRRPLVANAFKHDCSFHLVIPGRPAFERKDVRRSHSRCARSAARVSATRGVERVHSLECQG